MTYITKKLGQKEQYSEQYFILNKKIKNKNTNILKIQLTKYYVKYQIMKILNMTEEKTQNISSTKIKSTDQT